MDGHDHLVFECLFSNQIGKTFQVEMGLCNLYDRWEHVMDDISHKRWMPAETQRRFIFAVGVYFIWKERNGHLFKGAKLDVDQIVNDIKKVVALRCLVIARACPIWWEEFFVGRGSLTV